MLDEPRAQVIIATSAPTAIALIASVPEWIPELAASDTPAPSCARRMAIQRTGRRTSAGVLSSILGTTSISSRSISG